MDYLNRHELPQLSQPPMILGFTGWMDGGNVSTGTIDFLATALKARRFAEIDSSEFYIHHFPVAGLPFTVVAEGDKTVVRSISPMEQAAVFRPHAEIVNGIVRRLEFERNEFLFSADPEMILFTGAEPHVLWRTFAECLLGVAEEYGTREIIFIGSVASPIPHTRPPRVRSGISSEEIRLKRTFADGLYSNYEGPASFITYLLPLAASRGVEMRTLVVEIPHYPFLEVPTYPGSIHRVGTILADWFDLQLPLTELKIADVAMCKQLDEIMEDNEEFRDLVHRLEQAYDAEAASVDEQLLRRLIDEVDFGHDDHLC